MNKQFALALATSLLAATACDKPAGPTAEAPTAAEVAPPTAAEPAAAATAANATETAPAAEEVTVATVGQPAPDFELADEKGNKFKLSDLKGQLVVLEWINPECPVVQRVYGAKLMQDAFKEVGASVKWLAVDSSNFVKPEDSTKWKTEHATDWPHLQDPTGEVGRKYGAKTTPHMYVVDKDGVLRYSGAIDNDPHGKLDPSERKNHVVNAVKALTEGTEIAEPQTKPYGCSVKYGS